MPLIHTLRSRLKSTDGTTLSVAALCALSAFSALMMCAQLIFATLSTDQSSLERQERTAAQEMQELVEIVPRDQQTITIWDDAVVHTAEEYDPAWVDENIGSWVASYFGHNEIYVLDGEDNPTFGYAQGGVLTPAANYSNLAPLAPMVEELRRAFNQSRDTRLSRNGILAIGDRPVFASVSPILPSTSRVQVPSKPYFHVSIRYLDEAVAELQEAHQFKAATATTAPPKAGLASIPLLSSDGELAGHFTWEAYRPGAALMRKSAPAMLFSTALLGFLTWWASRRMLKGAAELKASEAQARHLAFHDPLTGLANRAMFMDRLSAAQNSLRDGENVAVHFIDLDDFKVINDSFGHGSGDQLLKDVASGISALLAEDELAARFSGDEFVYLQRGISHQSQVATKATDLLAAIRKVGAGHSRGAQISASLGVASSSEGVEPAELLRRANIALYRAKDEDRNGFQVFTPDLDQLIQDRRMLEVDLAAALAAGDQLHLVYQPLYSADGRSITGVEALARWEHPTKGSLPPSLFIPVAESSGLILTMGEWVLRTACKQAVTWDVRYIAVNVSPIQFRQPGFAASIGRILEETGLQPARLELEITEGVLVDKDRASLVLAELHAMGVRIALDDFGTGYSSLSYLRQLDVDKIKVDQSFTRHLAEDESARSIVLAMIQLAGALHMQVTAEGVETEEQRAYLSSMGCDQLQGYLFSKPLPADLLESKLRGGSTQEAA